MATIRKQLEQATAVTLLSTEMNSVVNGANAVTSSAVLNNAVGQANTDGYMWAKIELVLGAVGAAMTLNSGVPIYFLSSVDGTNYEDGDATVVPARAPDVVIGVRNVATAQRITRRIAVPVGAQKVLAVNSTGQTWNASGNTLKMLLSTDQGV
jgi:hypothetical protein